MQGYDAGEIEIRVTDKSGRTETVRYRLGSVLTIKDEVPSSFALVEEHNQIAAVLHEVTDGAWPAAYHMSMAEIVSRILRDEKPQRAEIQRLQIKCGEIPPPPLD